MNPSRRSKNIRQAGDGANGPGVARISFSHSSSRQKSLRRSSSSRIGQSGALRRHLSTFPILRPYPTSLPTAPAFLNLPVQLKPLRIPVTHHHLCTIESPSNRTIEECSDRGSLVQDPIVPSHSSRFPFPFSIAIPHPTSTQRENFNFLQIPSQSPAARVDMSIEVHTWVVGDVRIEGEGGTRRRVRHSSLPRIGMGFV